MSKKSLVSLLALFAFAVSLSGCASARRKNDLEIQSLRNQISALEAQIQSKDEEINALKESAARPQEGKEISAREASGKKVIPNVKSRPTVRHIQIALKNAGYNPGKIDGKMGRETRDAIKAFQTANNLPADGKAGKKTWELLREYLYKKVK